MTGSDTSEAPAASAHRRRRRALAVLLGLAVLAGAGVGTTWATDTGPFARQSFCWGAWHEDDGENVPDFLAEDTDGYERTSEQSAPPRKGKRANCSVTLKEKQDDSATDSADGYGDGSTTSGSLPADDDPRVAVEVGPVPRDAGERHVWLTDHLDAGMQPLPHGLPGLMGRERSLFVLPPKCDTADGRPTVVTVEGTSFPSGSGSTPDPLMSLVNTAAQQAGCAPEKPFAVTLPLPEPGRGNDLGGWRSPLCRIPGFRFELDYDDQYEARTGPVTDQLQTCSVDDRTELGNPVTAGQFVMTSQPRLAALFTGLSHGTPKGKGWRGKGEVGAGQALLTADCHGKPTVFYLRLDSFLADRAEPDTRRVFAATANSVADRIGCPAVAPTS
ncbi:hypothetical protein ACQEU8_28815 [Streptomyces sp. CA-250714]|uniref:hypothetical protein n=1 Tax=Streptomyces sp. CA-250714 TaxID=3240060 RepID=UPI003D92FF68